MDKSLTRAEIGHLLQPRSKESPRDNARRTLDAMDATVTAIEAGEIRHAYSVESIATAMGYLLVGCVDGANCAALQSITPTGVSAKVKYPSADELHAGIATIRSLLRRSGMTAAKFASKQAARPRRQPAPPDLEIEPGPP